jgi:ankyrin repeat protein
MLGIREDGLTKNERGLFGAIAMGDSEGVVRAIDEGARLDALNHHGHTPFMSAAWHGQAGCLRALGERGAIDGADAKGRSARALACRGREAMRAGVANEGVGRWSLDLLKALEEFAPEAKRDDDGMTPLMAACSIGWEQAAASYVALDDPLASTKWGDTALMHAAHAKSEACVKILLPLSNAWIENRHDMSAAKLARSQRADALADLIQEAARSQLEALALDRAAGPAVSAPKPPRI